MHKLYTHVIERRLRLRLLFVVLGGLVSLQILAQQQPQNGYSYVNITKRTVGGPVEPGDILEVRYSVHIPYGNTNSNLNTIYLMRYYDSLPSHTAIIESPTEYLRVITNEGVTVRQYTTTAGDDAGSYLPNPLSGQYHIRINLGANPGKATSNSGSDYSGAGRANVTSRLDSDAPKWFSGHLFSTAYRVRVTGNFGDTIQLGKARFYYRTSLGPGSTDKYLEAPIYNILISRQQPLCDNMSGTNFANENGGTFGSGTTLGRATGPSYSIPNFTYIPNPNTAGSVDDGRMTITKNTSPTQATSNTTVKRDPNCENPPATNTANNCNNRMFASWDIIGDHTGTTNSAGNPAPASGQAGGYMLVVNSNYVTGEAYKQDISGLCPNTTYEFSAWVRNLCTYCSWDMNLDRQTGNGVLPNLTFVLDNVDRYSTGEIAYGGWVKKGFTFTTGPNQNSVKFAIRNNAQGGGGNDWAMDDITISTCSPNLVMKPYGNAHVCYNNPVEFSADVNSYFNNYTTWRWEKSDDGGATWINGTFGTEPLGNLSYANGIYTYTVDFPPFLGDSNAHGDVVRLRIATTQNNLNTSGCSFLAASNVMIMVNNCEWVLSTDIKSFNARSMPSGVILSWETANETEGIYYIIEKSTDLVNWSTITDVPALVSGTNNSYTDLDANEVRRTTHYRIKMVSKDKWKYTHQVMVQPTSGNIEELAIKTLQNPFTSELPFEIITPDGGEAQVLLTDMYGKPVRKMEVKVQKGSNSYRMLQTGSLPSGNYIMTVTIKSQVTQKKVIKLNK